MKKEVLNIVIANNTEPLPYIEFLKQVFGEVVVHKFENIVKKANKRDRENIDLALFTGGEDVHPKYYGEPMGKHTSSSENRDQLEKQVYNFFMSKYTLKLGICRGSQFLTVMNRGKLIQHVNNHANGEHLIYDNHFGNYKITSTHHQMMYPFELPSDFYQIIAHSTYFRSDTYLNGINEEIKIPKTFLEPEIVHYPKSNSLCIQGHPELMSKSSEGRSYCISHIKNYLNSNNNN